MDGLLFDTEKMLSHFWKMAAAESGFEMNTVHSMAIRSTAPEKAEKILQGYFGKEFDYYKIRNRRRELMNDFIKENGLPMKTGVKDILLLAKKYDIKTSVATSTDLKRTEWYLTIQKIRGYFDEIATVDMVERGKPFPDIYLYAAKKLELCPNECVAFEDSPNGILSASRAGCRTFMIPDLSQPDEEISEVLWNKADNLSEAAVYIESVIKRERQAEEFAT